MRVIAGLLKGRQPKSPTWTGCRPTSDRLRETLVNILAGRVDGARVLDGYAGTGAVGIEALSRGAASVTFVDADRRARALIADNISRCGVAEGCAIIRHSFDRIGPFDLALLDPPYDEPPERVVPIAARLLAPEGVLVLEHAKRRSAPLSSSGLVRTRQVVSGDSVLSFYTFEPVAQTRMPTLAVYPGSFDPLTNGHVDIIMRGARLFDRIVVAMLVNAEKAPLFSTTERVEIAREVFKDHPNVEIDTFDGLLVDYVQRRRAQVIVRGLRAISDFEFEFQMALMNRRLTPDIETIFMMPAEQYTYISSRLIKEVFALGGRVDGLVPALVEERLRDKLQARSV